jgi:hypothetical protein
MLMKMLYEEKYTIEGAKKRLKDISGDDDSSAKSANEEIRAELIDILKILNFHQNILIQNMNRLPFIFLSFHAFNTSAFFPTFT